VPMNLIGDENPDLARSAVAFWSGVGKVQVWWGANYYSDAISGSPCWLVWDKDHHGMTFADAELAAVTARAPTRVFRHAWSGMHRASERGVDREHPTQKPVALYVWTMETVCRDAKIIVEPFGGSGTTLIAAAQTGRIARVIELDPKYCDVIRRRWTRWAKEHGKPVGRGALE
jgi:site-specific DNA-methyltransferase (adenine-specific)